MRLEAHMIARETRGFSEPLFRACLEAIVPNVERIVLTDNCCDQAIRDMYRQIVPKDKLFVVEIEGRLPFDVLRNAGIEKMGLSCDWLVFIDADEIWATEIFKEADAAAQAGYDMCRVGLKHLVVAPCWLDSHTKHTHPRFINVKKRPDFKFKGGIHEGPRVPGREIMLKTCHVHLGYCRPQWQTFLKIMRYDYLYYGHLGGNKKHLNNNLNKTPNNLWQDGKNLVPYNGPWHTLTSLIKRHGMSQESWFAYLESVEDYLFWYHWKELAYKMGNWADTLNEVFEEYFKVKLPSSE